jgi:dipeptidyl aminopeptidase/acylaminoacyl peptidase
MLHATNDALLVGDTDRWKQFDDTTGALLRQGRGLAIPGATNRLAVVHDGSVDVDGASWGEVDGRPRRGCWSDSAVTVVTEAGVFRAAKDGGSRLVRSLIQGDRVEHVEVDSRGMWLDLVPEDGGEAAWRVWRIRDVGLVDAVPDLSGLVSFVLFDEDGTRVARRSGGWSEVLSHWEWWRMMVDTSEGWRPLLDDDLHLAPGPCSWTPDRKVLFPVYDGIRIGAVEAEVRSGSVRWVAPDDDCSYSPVVSAGGGFTALRRRPQGTVEVVRIDQHRNASTIAEVDDRAAPPTEHRRWRGVGGGLEGLWVEPTDGAASGVVIHLHGGPEHVLYVGGGHQLNRWHHAGFSALAPEYADAGIGGPGRYIGAWAPPDDPNVEDVLSGIAALGAETEDVHLFGHSWGASLLLRLVATGRRFRSAFCWEGFDTRSLPGPSRWVPDLAANVTPLQFAYGNRGPLQERGPKLLDQARVGSGQTEMWIYEGGHAPDEPVLSELYDRAAAWFRRWQ